MLYPAAQWFLCCSMIFKCFQSSRVGCVISTIDASAVEATQRKVQFIYSRASSTRGWVYVKYTFFSLSLFLSHFRKSSKDIEWSSRDTIYIATRSSPRETFDSLQKCERNKMDAADLCWSATHYETRHHVANVNRSSTTRIVSSHKWHAFRSTKKSAVCSRDRNERAYFQTASNLRSEWFERSPAIHSRSNPMCFDPISYQQERERKRKREPAFKNTFFPFL